VKADAELSEVRGYKDFIVPVLLTLAHIQFVECWHGNQ